MKSSLYFIGITMFYYSVGISQQIDNSVSVTAIDSALVQAKRAIDKMDYESAKKILSLIESDAKKYQNSTNDQYRDFSYLIGQVYFNTNNFPKAEEYLVTALNLYSTGKDSISLNTAQCHGLIAQAGMQNGNFQNTEQHFLDAMQIRKKVYGDKHSEYAKGLNNLATFYASTQNLQKAEYYYLACLEVRKLSPGKNTVDYASTLRNLGELYDKTGRMMEGKTFVTEAIEIQESLHVTNTSLYAMSLLQLSTNYDKSGNSEKHEEYLLKSLRVFQDNPKLQKNRNYGNTLNSLGVYYYYMGLQDKAMYYYELTKDVYEKYAGKSSPSYAAVVNNLARINMDIGNYQKAADNFNFIVNYYEKATGKMHTDYLEAWGNVLLLRIKQQDKTLHDSLFLNHLKMSMDLLGEQHYDIATSLRMFASYKYLQEDYKKAIELDNKALNILENVYGAAHTKTRELLLELSKLYYRDGNVVMALHHNRRAQDIIKMDMEMAIGFLSDRELNAYIQKINKDNYNFYHDLTTSHPNDPVIGELYNDALFLKGKLLYTLMKRNSLLSRDSSLADISMLYRNIRKELAIEYSKPIKQRKDTKKLESESEDLEKKLNKKLDKESELNKVTKWQDIAKVLKPGEAVIEFIDYTNLDNSGKVNDRYYAALILLPNSQLPLYIPLCSETQLASFIKKETSRRMEYVSSLYQNAQEKSVNQDLYKLIWKPIELKIPNTNTIYYSNSGLLHRINLKAIALNKKKRVMDKYEVILLPSSRDLLYTEENAINQTGKCILIGGVQYDLDSTINNRSDSSFAFRNGNYRGQSSFYENDSTFRKDEWHYLPGTLNEIELVSKILADSFKSIKSLSAHSATEQAFKEISNTASPALIHISTHGYFFSDFKKPDSINTSNAFKTSTDPMIRSGLILAGANYAWVNGKAKNEFSEDGILTAYEISQMDLSNTSLVVLSACETGLGDIEANEGVYGLQRAFKIAGVGNILMSLWQVPDKQTSQLMEIFYTNLIKKKLSVRESLSHAQNTLRQKGLEPYYWAGFVVVE